MNAVGPTNIGETTATKLPETVKNSIEAVSDGVKNTYSAITEGITDSAEYVKGSIDQFGSSEAVADASTSFLESNTLIAKFAFLLFVLIVFLFLVDLGIKLIGYFTQPKGNPYLISGTMNASNEIIISQDPKNSGSIPILRSNNQSKGIEFTWSVWIYINDINNKAPQYQNVFNKGNGSYNKDGFATVNNGPGLYIDNSGHQLVVAMNTVSNLNPTEFLYIKDMPLRKWFHCTMRLENTILDTYINGTIVGRLTLQDVPKQNYEDVNICRNGGFNGSIADLRYYNYALSVFEINNIVMWGRNTKNSGAAGSSDSTGFPYYLSNLWYSANY